MVRYSTLLKLLVVAGILAGAGWVIWQAYCSSCCKSALTEADRLASKGNVREALYEIDDADATCDCLKHTEEEPPQMLVRARQIYERASRQHGHAAAFELLRNANGPILQGLAEE